VKTIVILNPASGRGRARRLFPTIQAKLRASGLDFDLLLSERPWHTAELAEAAAVQDTDVVVAAGGDGTIHEAINGIMHAKLKGFTKTALGLLSIGSGNDLAFSLNIPTKLDAAIQALIRNKRRLIDIGLLKGCNIPGGRYFANCVGIGFDAAGGILAEKITWTRGVLAYFIAAVQNIFFYYKAPTLEIELDGEFIHKPLLLVSVMNGKRIGGGFLTGPDAIFDDGLFDLCIAEEVSRLRMFTLIPHFLRGTQGSQPEIQMKRSSQVQIMVTKGTMPIQADGEILDQVCQQVNIEILPRQLEIIGF